MDSSRNKEGFRKIISEVEQGTTDILVGTQLVTKGFDFPMVTLVGIMDIDRQLHYPDFRSFEKTYQLLTQVSGRSGRRNEKGRVIIQTYHPQHFIFGQLLKNDFREFYKWEIEERKKFIYPPFSRLIRIIARDKEESVASALANQIVIRLTAKLDKKRVLGPESSLISRIKNQYLFEIMIKVERNTFNLSKVKQAILKELKSLMNSDKKYSRSQVIIDVDPV